MHASDKNNTNKIIQMSSEASEFDPDQKVFALLLTEMIKVKCKDLINKSKFGLFGSAVLLIC